MSPPFAFSLSLLLSSCSTPGRYTLMRAAEFKPFRTPPRHNHVITRIKRSLLVGTNLISEFPAANYLCRRWSPVMDLGSNGQGTSRRDATRRVGPRRRNSRPLAKLLRVERARQSRPYDFFLLRWGEKWRGARGSPVRGTETMLTDISVVLYEHVSKDKRDG